MSPTFIFKNRKETAVEINPKMIEKLLASSGGKLVDCFGDSVAADAAGLTVVACFPNAKVKGPGSGAGYILTKQDDGSYLQTQKLIASDGEAGDKFGYNVDISGDGSVIIVGALQEYSQISTCVFTRQANGSYLETQKLVASDMAAYEQFGTSVAISNDGSTIIIGAYFDDDKGPNSGSVFVFAKQSNGTYLQIQKLVALDGAARDYFGSSVTVSGDGSTLVVGAEHDGDKGDNSGSAYVFTKQANGSYLQTQKLTASDGAADNLFGFSVAISNDGSTLVVGARNYYVKTTESGSAYVFIKQTDGSYLQTQKLIASNGAAGDRFGYYVTISENGSTIVVDDCRWDDRYYNYRSAHIFTKQANGSYLFLRKLR